MEKASNEIVFTNELLTKDGVAVDASFVPKSGKHTDGLGYFWNGSRQKSERGLEISSICVVDMQANTAYALNARQTIDTENDDEVRTQQYTGLMDCQSCASRATSTF